MSRAPVSQLTALLATAVIGVIALAFGVFFLLQGPSADVAGWVNAAMLYVMALFCALLGILIVSRQQRNLIGWLLLSAGLCVASQGLSENYATYALITRPGALPGGLAMAWLTNIVWAPYVIGLFLIPFVFPTGRPLSRRWQWVIIALLALSTILTIVHALAADFIGLDFVERNPTGILPTEWVVQVENALLFPILALFLAGGLSLVLRYRRSNIIVRQQIKWFVLAMSISILAIVVSNVATPDWNWSSVLVNIILLGIPLSIGLSVLRYRLFDIDVIIRKTLQYGLLTALLALVYFGSVVLLQTVFGAAVSDSPLLIVISTLLIAALFGTLRVRVQRFIDRRFFRQKYDAQLVLANFARHARDEVELEALTDEVTRVVQATLQPEQVSVWLQRP